MIPYTGENKTPKILKQDGLSVNKYKIFNGLRRCKGYKKHQPLRTGGR